MSTKSKKKKKKKKFEIPKFTKKTKLLFCVVLFATTLLTISTYAWFSASLNVKVKFINMKVSTDTGLFISLDGVNFSSEIEVSRESIIDNITNVYPNHTNQWAANGLWTVSTIGIPNSNTDKFSMFYGEIEKYRYGAKKGQKYLITVPIRENAKNEGNRFVAFDVFFKNVSGSPKSDNLYLTEYTFFDFDEDVDDEKIEKMAGIMNSMRLGIVRIGDTTLKSTPEQIQNLNCNNNCVSVIYEPFSTVHTQKSIDDAAKFGITLTDGEYVPTYGVYKDGMYLNHKSSFVNSGVDLDTEHFALQTTRRDEDFDTPLFQIPNGITKCRVYIWLEGQDIDSIETNSVGAPIDLGIDFIKDLAGYEGL